MRIDSRFENVINFRDLGGLKTNDGRIVKDGYFYRGSALNFYSEEELKTLAELNIKTIMDIRSSMEIEMHPDPEIEGARNIEYSGLVVEGAKEIDWSPIGMKKIGGEAQEQLAKIRHYYSIMAFNNEAFRIMVKEIVDGHLPIYFHCATGKDRTGVAAMVIEMLLNVTKEEMRKDYLMSNIFRKEILEDSLKSVEDIAVNNPEINILITLQDGVREEIFDIVMNSIEEKYSSYDEYIMKEYKLNEEDLIKLRDLYTY